MVRFFHWGERDHRWHDLRRHRWHRHEGDHPGFPFPPLSFPPVPHIDVNEDEFAPADEEAEIHHRRRPRWSHYQGDQELDELTDGIAAPSMETRPRRRTGRWVRHRRGIILLGV